ncbi:hypothetical protein ACP6L2_07645 [Sphingobacterium lactis]|uniref:hypothetical protein n=1 Tax=Sphingobacterium lactis TaxID=797291 RepID=UPI003F7F903D
MKPLLTVACLLLLMSCNQQNEKTNTNKPKQEEVVAEMQEEVKNTNNTIPELEELSLKEFPFVDSTNFDNDDNQGIKDADLLKRIRFDVEDVNLKQVRLRYKLNYSPNYYSVVLTYPLGEHELITTLFNINKRGKILDFLDIAYDEIAESAFRKESLLKKNEVILTDWNYMSEEPTKTVTRYSINEQGKFEEVGE